MVGCPRRSLSPLPHSIPKNQIPVRAHLFRALGRKDLASPILCCFGFCSRLRRPEPKCIYQLVQAGLAAGLAYLFIYVCSSQAPTKGRRQNVEKHHLKFTIVVVWRMLSESCLAVCLQRHSIKRRSSCCEAVGWDQQGSSLGHNHKQYSVCINPAAP